MGRYGLKKAACLIAFITVLSKIAGFIRESLIAGAFGATYKTDAYIMSLTMPGIIFGVFGVAITTTFIPILAEDYKMNKRQDTFEFVNTFNTLLLAISLLACILIWCCAPVLIRIIAPGFSQEVYKLTVILTRISAISIMFMGMNSSFVALLQTFGVFIAPALSGLVFSMPIIAYILLGGRYGVKGLAFATVSGYGAQVIILIPWLIKNRYRYRPNINIRDTRIRRLLRLMAPVVIGTEILQLNEFVDRVMASGLPAGSISALNFAAKLNNVIYSVFAVAIITVIYPELSMECDDYEEFTNHIIKAVNIINMIMVPSAVGLAILRVPIINVLFRHGAFDSRAAGMTSEVMLYYSLGLVFSGMAGIFDRVFYAMKDTRTPMTNGVIAMGVNINLNFILIRYMGIGGLAMSTSISSLVYLILLINGINKRIGRGIAGRSMAINCGKILMASVVMGACVFVIDKCLSEVLTGIGGEIIRLVVSVVSGILTYVFMIAVLREKEFMSMIRSS